MRWLLRVLQTAEDLHKVIARIWHDVRRTDTSLALLAFASFGLGGLLSHLTLPAVLSSLPVAKWLPWIFYLVALVAISVLVWRLRYRPFAQPPRPPIGPSPIKGPLPFDSADRDGALFQELGREEDIAQPLAYVNDDLIPIVTVRGPIGVGKTSLLRAGLQYRLKSGTIPCAYWAADREAVESKLLHALRFEFGEQFPTLDAFVACQEGARQVVILDKLDQLDPDSPAHRRIFELFLRDAERPAPHRITWVVAFRDSFRQRWLELSGERLRDLTVPDHAVRLFSEAHAREVMKTLADHDNLGLEPGIRNDLIVGKEISPVQVAIPLDCLSRLRHGLRKTELRMADYRSAGSAHGLLARYLDRHLANDNPEERRDVFRALRALVDWEAKPPRRIESGVRLEVLAAEARMSPARLELHLKQLVQARLLEDVDWHLYRLQHDQLIPVLGTSDPGPGDTGRLLYFARYKDWQLDPSARNLLKPGELAAAVIAVEAQKDGVQQDEEQIRFVRRSWLYRLGRGALAFGLLVFPLAIFLYYRYSSSVLDSARLASWSLPTDLYTVQRQLDALALPRAVNEISWLSGNIHALKLRRFPRDAAHPRPWPQYLPRELAALDISDLGPSVPSRANWDVLTSVHGLPQSLRYLNVNFNDRLAQLDGLGELPNLLSLAARDKGVTKFDALPPTLRCVEIGSAAFDSASLALLKRRLPDLSVLRLQATGVARLADLPAALDRLGLYDNLRLEDAHALDQLPAGLEALAVDGSPPSPSLDHLPAGIKELHLGRVSLEAPLRNLPACIVSLGLQDVRLAPQDAAGLILPASLRSLTWIGSELRLAALPASLRSLSITFFRPGSMPAVRLPDGLAELTLANVRVGDIGALPKSLKHLDLRLASELVDVSRLPPRLEALNLSRAVNLHRLANLPSTLRYLNVSGTRLGQLPSLPAAVEELDISGTAIHDLAGLPPHLRVLTLSAGQLKTLDGLPPSVRDLRFVDDIGGVADLSHFECGSWLSEPGGVVPR